MRVASLLTAFNRYKLPWAGALAALLALLIGQSELWRGLELRLYDRLAVATAPDRVDLPITIVGIDEASFAALQRQWPWPRAWHGQLLDRLAEAGVAVSAFDVVFSEPSNPADDRAFAEAIARAGNVVLAADLLYRETEGVRQWLRVEPDKGLVAAGAVPGFASVQLDPDGVQRNVPVFLDAFWHQVLERFDRQFPGVAARMQAGDDMRIRYLGGPHTFKYIPYYQMLEPDRYLPANWREYLKDNIVLIGRDLKATTEVGSAQADMFQTPYFARGKELMPGVEIHANLIANMVTGEVIREAPRSWPFGLWFGAAAISLLAMRRWQPIKSGLAGLGLIAVIGVVNYLLFSRQLLWLPVAQAMLTVLLIYLAQGGVAYFIEQRQRRQIKQAFSMYVSPAVVDKIVANPEQLKLGGERQELTLLFTDLAGFTTISEALGAEQVTGILNRHLSEMVEIVFRYHGTVDKFIGDAVMAFWGAPIADPEQSLHAVQAAVAMQQKIAEMRQDLLAQDGPDLHMRIGLHRGECIVGNMGGVGRFDYTAVGDTVNLASRLEGVNKVYGTGILLSQSVAEAIGDRLMLRQVDTVRVKGKHLGVPIFTPCGDARLKAMSEAALAAYSGGEWEICRERWQAVADAYPDDPVAHAFLARLRDMQANGWPKAWDGITTLETK